MMQTASPTLLGYEHIKRYWDVRHQSIVAKVLPGEFYVTKHSEVLTTVVGSCVSACIYDPSIGLGGMNHFMLPTGKIPPDRWENTAVSAANRYGNYAMEHVINDILKYGGRRERLQVKLFGGGQIISSMAAVGQQNIEFVRHYVLNEGLHLVASDLGDMYPRKLLFYPKKGLVRVKKLRGPDSDKASILQQETAYQRSLNQQQSTDTDAGDVDLF